MIQQRLKSIASHAAAFAAAAIIDRFIPAIAAGLVAAAHELHFESARAEAERRHAEIMEPVSCP